MLAEGCEIIGGEEVRMAPAGYRHNDINYNLARMIKTYMKGFYRKVTMDSYIKLGEGSIYAPDIAVFCGPYTVNRDLIEGIPDFVAEILSPATRKNDISVKKDAYEKFGVREYWIVNPREESIEAYLLRDGKYALDNVYHSLSDEERRLLLLEQPPLRVSFCDVEMDIGEVFEE